MKKNHTKDAASETLSVDQLLIELANANTDAEKSWISLQFNLGNQPDVVRNAVFAASVPHWFDQPMLEYLLESKFSKAEFESLVQLPYIERYDENSWNVHDKTRLLLLRHLSKLGNSIFKRFSRKSAAWARKRQAVSPIWTIEAVYHSVLAGENESADFFVQTAIRLLNSRRDTYLEILTQQMLEATDADLVSTDIIAWCWYFIASLDLIAGRIGESESAVERASAINAANPQLNAECKLLVGQIYMRRGRPRDALTQFERAGSKFREINQVVGQANSISCLGHALSHIARLDEARSHFEIAKSLFNRVGEAHGQANCEYWLGEVALYKGDYSDATKRFKVSEASYAKISDKFGVANCQLATGRLALEYMNFDGARKKFLEAYDGYSKRGSDLGVSNAYRELGDVAMHLRNFSEAEELYHKALKMSLCDGNRLGEANSLRSLGKINIERGDFDVALPWIRAAKKIYKENGYFFGEAFCEFYLAQIEDELDNFESALEAYVWLLGHPKSQGSPAVRSTVLAEIAQAYASRNNIERAESSIESAYQLHPSIAMLLIRFEINFQKRDVESAGEDLMLAEAINPSAPALLFSKGKFFLLKGELDKADGFFVESASKFSDEGDVLLWRALTSALLGGDYLPSLTEATERCARPSTLRRYLAQIQCFSTEIPSDFTSTVNESLIKLFNEKRAITARAASNLQLSDY